MQRDIDQSEDPEQKLLLKILDKMLSKHRPQKLKELQGYINFKPREWESIEEKLEQLDLRADFPTFDTQEKFRKDFVRPIQDQIRQVIATGKQARSSNITAVKAKLAKMNASEANVAIRLLQLKSSVQALQGLQPHQTTN